MLYRRTGKIKGTRCEETLPCEDSKFAFWLIDLSNHEWQDILTCLLPTTTHPTPHHPLPTHIPGSISLYICLHIVTVTSLSNIPVSNIEITDNLIMTIWVKWSYVPE